MTPPMTPSAEVTVWYEAAGKRCHQILKCGASGYDHSILNLARAYLALLQRAEKAEARAVAADSVLVHALGAMLNEMAAAKLPLEWGAESTIGEVAEFLGLQNLAEIQKRLVEDDYTLSPAALGTATASVSHE